MKSQKNKYAEAVKFPVLDPFPEPRTMPDGWDLSELISDQQLPLSTQATSLNEPDSNL